ncbi:MAG TPA: nuclear transport factor 2 family protein [Bryobacteraceae bacterium]
MRVLAILVLALPTCWAQSDQSKVEAVLKQMERAEQTGDFNAWAALWTREKSGEVEKMRPYVSAKREVRYHATKTFVRGDKAVLLVQGTSNSFVTMTLQRQGGQWKIQEQVWGDTAPDPNSVYALAPPDPGAFARAGSRWDHVAPAMDPSQAARLGWQVKAVFDESYLYIRIESSTELPAPGSTIGKPPGGWPVLKIGTSDGGEFVLYDAVDVGDQATFDEHGKANSHRPFAAYSIRLERNGHEVFSASADLHPSPLVEVVGRDYDIRIPLRTMSIIDSRATRMTVGDAQWPKSAVVNIAVQRYPH